VIENNTLKHCLRTYLLFLQFIAGIVIIVSSANLSALEKSPVSVFAEKAVLSFSNDKPVVLEVNAGVFSTQIEQHLREALFAKDYKVLDMAIEEAYHSIRVNYEEIIQIHKHNKVLARKNILHIRHIFYYQVLDYPESKLIHYQRIDCATEQKTGKSEMRWYDPVLITAVIGSLVYLFYYGIK